MASFVFWTQENPDVYCGNSLFCCNSKKVSNSKNSLHAGSRHAFLFLVYSCNDIKQYFTMPAQILFVTYQMKLVNFTCTLVSMCIHSLLK